MYSSLNVFAGLVGFFIALIQGFTEMTGLDA